MVVNELMLSAASTRPGVFPFHPQESAMAVSKYVLGDAVLVG